jgi:hypothetical protein
LASGFSCRKLRAKKLNSAQNKKIVEKKHLELEHQSEAETEILQNKDQESHDKRLTRRVVVANSSNSNNTSNNSSDDEELLLDANGNNIKLLLINNKIENLNQLKED